MPFVPSYRTTWSRFEHCVSTMRLAMPISQWNLWLQVCRRSFQAESLQPPTPARKQFLQYRLEGRWLPGTRNCWHKKMAWALVHVERTQKLKTEKRVKMRKLNWRLKNSPQKIATPHTPAPRNLPRGYRKKPIAESKLPGCMAYCNYNKLWLIRIY